MFSETFYTNIRQNPQFVYVVLLLFFLIIVFNKSYETHFTLERAKVKSHLFIYIVLIFFHYNI